MFNDSFDTEKEFLVKQIAQRFLLTSSRLTAAVLFSAAVPALAEMLPSGEEMDSRRIHEITILCEQLWMDYAIYRDHLDADGFANTFTEDGQLIVGSGTHTGPAALRKYIRDHESPGFAHMVMITTTDITPLSETRAVGTAYALVNGSDRHVGQGDAPIQSQHIGAANEYYAEFEQTDEGWKIAKMSLRGVFSGPRD